MTLEIYDSELLGLLDKETLEPGVCKAEDHVDSRAVILLDH